MKGRCCLPYCQRGLAERDQLSGELPGRSMRMVFPAARPAQKTAATVCRLPVPKADVSRLARAKGHRALAPQCQRFAVSAERTDGMPPARSGGYAPGNSPGPAGRGPNWPLPDAQLPRKGANPPVQAREGKHPGTVERWGRCKPCGQAAGPR